MNRRWHGFEVALEIGFGRSLPIEFGVGVDKCEVLALFGRVGLRHYEDEKRLVKLLQWGPYPYVNNCVNSIQATGSRSHRNDYKLPLRLNHD